MALYISTENQTMLWEMINKVTNFSTVFPLTSSLESKTSWFKSQIQQIYQKLPPNISREQLKQINRDTLTTMLQSLQSIQQNTSPITPTFSRLEKATILPEQQYRPLYDNQKPPEPNFTEKLDDQAITNMSELIEKKLVSTQNPVAGINRTREIIGSVKVR